MSPLAGTSSELEHGVGGSADHPAPAAIVEDGILHLAGEPPAGNVAIGQAPAGDSTDVPSGDVVTDPEARARLSALHELEQVETKRPDIGTPE